MIIDSHTHIFNEETYKTYFEKAKGKISKAIIMHWREIDLAKLLEFASSKGNLYVVATINTNDNIENQLEICQKLFQEKKIFGIKMYPGYQHFYPSDKIVDPIAKLCQKYNKPLVFHSGDFYDPDKKSLLKYSHPIHIDELAIRFPECKIIISHLGFPFHLEAANVVYKNDNVYTDISGTIEKVDTRKEAKDLFNQYVKDLKRIIAYFPDIKEKTMFGTDYSGEETPLNEVGSYIKVVKKVFPKENQENVFYNLAKRLFFED